MDNFEYCSLLRLVRHTRMAMGLIVLVPWLNACDADPPAGDGRLVTFDTVCDNDNEGRRVSLEGFLDFPDSFNLKGASVVMRLQSAPTRSSRVIGARAKLNGGTNTVMGPPDKYNETDLKVVTHDCKSAGYRTRLKLTGVMSYTDSLETRDFKCFLRDTRIEIAGAAASK